MGLGIRNEASHNMNAEASEQEKHPWLGPAIFIVVLIALVLFFIWFL